MKSIVPILAAAFCATLHAAEVPKAFEGLLEKETPVRAEIVVVVPPPEIDKYVAKVEENARKNPEWFRKYADDAKPGAPLPFHENLGLTREEYDEYMRLWNAREFKAVEAVVLVLRQSGESWNIAATGPAGALATLRYDPKEDRFRSPNGPMTRLEDIKADPLSILGEWSGAEWRFEEETSLGKTKENLAIGRFADNKHGIIVYRIQEQSSSGSRLLDKSMVIRFLLGKAGQIQPQAAANPAPAKK